MQETPQHYYRPCSLLTRHTLPPPPLLPCRYFPTILIVLLAVFNDGAMIALSKDNVTPSRLPNRWNLTSIFLAGELLSWRRQAGGAELAALSWQR